MLMVQAQEIYILAMNIGFFIRQVDSSQGQVMRNKGTFSQTSKEYP